MRLDQIKLKGNTFLLRSNSEILAFSYTSMDMFLLETKKEVKVFKIRNNLMKKEGWKEIGVLMVVVGGIRDKWFWGGLKERIWVLIGLDQGFWWMWL